MILQCSQVVLYERQAIYGPIIAKNIAEHYTTCLKCKNRSKMWRIILYRWKGANHLGTGLCIFVGDELSAKKYFDLLNTTNGKLILINNHNVNVKEMIIVHGYNLGVDGQY